MACKCTQKLSVDSCPNRLELAMTSNYEASLARLKLPAANEVSKGDGEN